MHPIHDAPQDRAVRRVLTWVIVGGALVGALFGVPRYGPVSVGNVGLMGLGVMVALGLYAAVLAVLPSVRADDDYDDYDPEAPPRP